MNKQSQIRLKYGLIIGFVILSIITLTFISAPTTPNNKLIISKGINNINSSGTAYINGWRVVSKTGIESQLTFWKSSNDKKVELGWIPPNNDCTGWLPMNIFSRSNLPILDDKSKDILVKCESAKCDGKNCYYISLTTAQAININDYIKLGNQSFIITYQNESKVVYDFDYGQTNFTLFKNNQLVTNELFVYWNESKYKFGAIDNSLSEGELRNYTYLINSTNELVMQEQEYYAGENYTFYNETTYDDEGNINGTLQLNYSFPILYPYPLIYNFKQENGYEARFVYDFVDICSKNYSNCNFQLSNDKKSAIVNFVSDKYIDPTAGATNVSNCLTLSSANTYYQLNTSISNDTITGDCIIISAANVTFDCDGYSITSIKNFTGVYSNQFNSTVKNCNISMGSGDIQAKGIELTDASDNSTIINNTGFNNYYGIVTSGEYGLISDNSFNTTYASSNGIFLSGANYNNLTNNYGESLISYGIYLSASNNNTLIENNATSINLSGIYISTSNNNTLIENIGITYTSGTGGGIRILSGTGNSLINNTGIGIGGTTAYGIIIADNNNVLTGNNGTSTSSYGIYIGNSIYNNLTSNTGTSNSSYGIYLSNSDNNNLMGNNGTSNSNIGIYLFSSSNNILTGNIASGGPLNSYGALTLRSSNNNHLINNTGITGTIFESQGIVLWVSANNTLINNTGISNSSYGIYFSGSSNNTLTSNTGTSNISGGIYLVTNSNNNTLIDNTGTSGTGTNVIGIGLGIGANNNVLINNLGSINYSGNQAGIYLQSAYNNTLINNTGISNYSYGVYLINLNNNRIINQNATGYFTGSYGIVLRNASNNNISDCVDISGVTKDVYLYNQTVYPSINNIFLNCSYDLSDESILAGSSLIRKWWYIANATDTNNVSVVANITATNSSENLEFSIMTNSNGLTNLTEITEYVNTGGTRRYYSNYTINATNLAYTPYLYSHSFNASGNNYNDEFIFTTASEELCREINTPGVYTLNGNIIPNITSGSCINITVSNVIFDCNTKYINNESSDIIGINVINANNVTIKNCNIIVSSIAGYGIYIQNSSYSNLSNNIIYNASTGMYLSYLNNSIVKSNTISYSLNYGFRFTYSTNNTIESNTASINNILYGTSFSLENSDNNNLISNTASPTNSTYSFYYSNSNYNNMTKTASAMVCDNYPSCSVIYLTQSSNNLFYDFTIISNVNTTYLTSSSFNNNFINTTYTNEYVQAGTSSSMNRKWWYMSYVNFTNGTAVEDASVSAYTNVGSLYFSYLTNSSGWINKTSMLEYVNSGTKTYYNNYSINVTKTGFNYVSKSENITLLRNQLNDVFTINETALTDTIYPIFSNNKTSRVNGTKYNPSNNYQFNITIINTNRTTGIEFNGINYSLSNISSLFNKTFAPLGTGTYSYYFWAYGNGTSNLFNSSIIYSYTISKNTSAVVYTYLNNSRSNITILNNTGIYLNLTLFNVSGIVNLYNNGTLINSEINTTSNFTAFNSTGLFNITGIYLGNENYTGSYETWWINVNAPICSQNLVNTSWSSWLNIGCIGTTGYHNESRNLTQYDSNNCGYVNQTFFEYRSILNASCNAPDTSPPSWTNLRNFTQEVNNSFSQSITATDLSGIGNYKLNQTNYFIINSTTGLITNITNLSRIEFHWLNISVNDTLGYLNSGIFYINITDVVVVTVVPEVSGGGNGNTGSNFDISIDKDLCLTINDYLERNETLNNSVYSWDLINLYKNNFEDICGKYFNEPKEQTYSIVPGLEPKKSSDWWIYISFILITVVLIAILNYNTIKNYINRKEKKG